MSIGGWIILALISGALVAAFGASPREAARVVVERHERRGILR